MSIAELHVALVADVDQFQRTMQTAAGQVDGFSRGMTNAGRGMTAGVTAPILGIGGASLAMATDLNAGLANVASLGGEAAALVGEWKPQIQDAAIAVGKGTGDMADGLYQVVSAFGAAGDPIGNLEINARAAAAGLSSTAEAINLTSAVTKGFGDTSNEAVQHAADLALMTVQLGQTTFPELAASMGKVVPIGAALGVSQEELFAQMATLTGVTGNTAEVSTQLRATYQALLAPTNEMAGAMNMVAQSAEQQGQLVDGPMVAAWRGAGDAYQQAIGTLGALESELANTDATTAAGAERARELEAAIKDQEKAAADAGDAWRDSAAALGPALVDSLGLTDALGQLSDQAGGNTDTLSSMFGSVEALNAVLALSGPQAETFAEKLSAMGGAAGATDEAFAAQTDGINKLGFQAEQAKAQMQVWGQTIGDQLLPILVMLLPSVQPFIDGLGSLIARFAEADPATQRWIVGLAGVAAAIGPVLIFLGMMGSGIATVMGFVGSLSGAWGTLSALFAGTATGPLAGVVAFLTGPVGLAIAGVALAVGLLYLAWQTDFGGMRDFVAGIWSAIQTGFAAFKALFSGDFEGFLTLIEQAWETAWTAITDFVGNLWDMASVHFSAFWTNLTTWVADTDWGQIGYDIVTFILETLASMARWQTEIRAWLSTLLPRFIAWVREIDWRGIANAIVEGIAAGLRFNAAIRDALVDMARGAWDAVRNFFGVDSPSKLFMGLGANLVEGAAIGVANNRSLFSDAVLGLGDDAALPTLAPVGVALPRGGGAFGRSDDNGLVGGGRVQQTIYIGDIVMPADTSPDEARGIIADGLRLGLRQRGAGG